MEKKLEILTTIREKGMDLNELLEDYKEFYTEENKIHVVDVAGKDLKSYRTKKRNENERTHNSGLA